MASADTASPDLASEDTASSDTPHHGSDPHRVTTLAQLEALYDKPFGPSMVKEIDHVNAHYRAFIEAAPFFVLASVGPEGVDCSPRGDAPGFVRVTDERTLMIPDRRGNNRIDSLRNIVRDPRVSLLFLIPGVGETFRIIGRASISTDPALLESFVFAGKTPRAVIIVTAERVYFQCSKAIIRSKLWEAETKVDRKSLPSNGTIIAAITQGREGGEEYDRAYPARLRETIY
jgi:PPOX class probable FMN-dependent enzyme